MKNEIFYCDMSTGIDDSMGIRILMCRKPTKRLLNSTFSQAAVCDECFEKLRDLGRLSDDEKSIVKPC